MKTETRADNPDEHVGVVATASTYEEPGESPTYEVMYAVMVERIFWHCGGAMPAGQISTVVRGCIADLAGSPSGALPELAERLATQRVADLLVRGS